MTDVDDDPFRDRPDPVDAQGRPLSVSVVIATMERPDEMRICLEHLAAQSARPREVVVVDASSSSSTAQVMEQFPWARYFRNDAGVGTLPRSRRIGVDETDGEVVAFLDDDAYADEGWLQALAAAYEPGIGGVGGQARNGVPDELTDGLDEIGRLLPNGLVTGHFAADPGRDLDVDHLIGCNMSFRREALAASGGIPEWPAGVSALREDLFLSLRVRDAGWRLRFTPRAGVFHVGAPQVKGRRFDLRYDFTGVRNHLFVLVVHFGIRSPYVRRAIATTLARSSAQATRSAVGALARPLAALAGVGVGLWRGLTYPRDAATRS
jgi:GT2 family glycosyltransferase